MAGGKGEFRIALFGGTFDPPHRGHVAVARAAADAFGLQRVLWSPVGRQPLKDGAPGSPWAARLEMVGLACQADRRFRMCSLDAPRTDHSANYTVDTLQRIQDEWPEAKLFNVVGADSFGSLARWRDPERLLELAEWIVLSRPGVSLVEPPGMTLTTAQLARIHPLDTLHEDVSATGLRRRLLAGDQCADLLPAGVASYIEEHGLYH